MTGRRVDASCYTPWTRTEHELAVEATGREDFEVLAAMIGRTPAAVQTRHYAALEGKVARPLDDVLPDPRTTHRAARAYRTAEQLLAKPYIGAADEDGDRWWETT